MTELPIYLDHNATTPILPEVAEAVREASSRYPGNPASQHDAGRQSRRRLEAAREAIGELLGAKTSGMDADRVLFTSGGTEANNLALFGLPLQKAGHGRIVISALEHPSVARAADRLAEVGWRVDRLGAGAQGVVRAGELAESLDQGDVGLVSVMLASNETGVLQPVAEIAAICRDSGVLVHTDAVQVVGKLSVDFRSLGVDALSATAHKFHGPPGVGVLVVRHGVTLQPMMYGGFQQAASRPGTECVALAVGMQAAVELWRQGADERRERMTALRDRFEVLIKSGYANAIVIGASAPRLPHTSNIAFPGIDRQAAVMAFDLAGVACSTGSACASGSSEPSPALVAMGLSEAVISSSVRFSLGAATTIAEVEEAARRILKACNHLRRQ